MKALPPWAALCLAGLGGVASAAQSAANAELGVRVGSAVLGAVVNNLGGCLIVLAGLFLMPSMRSGLRALRHARLPWWAYLGGAGGAFLVTAATYAVPVLGVAVFTIAQVAGNSLGGLAVDRTGLAPAGRLALTGPRVAGALLGIGAVALSQLGRPVGEFAVGVVLLAVAAGLAVALQSALNGRVSAASTTAAGTAVNFAVGTPLILAVAAAVGAFGAAAHARWPSQWYLYCGGLLGVCIVVILLLSVRSVGVLRTGLSVVGGQLAGAMLLDVLLPGKPAVTPALLAGAVLTLLAVVVSGRAVRPVATGT
ncbi:transporter family-2 protein [Micromonospora pattaloongensis]|uniref:Transporter family-2 protein n=1 Tax=Micromonospora pattaloongensis TaxID=405436 RepID=A0A1H3S307_9ACTN|nr:DMT family transporter [Micromonospora pattaloongensis]SDZ31965.1 transporter family-2 protein [Micromonospora pattaloongensis]